MASAEKRDKGRQKEKRSAAKRMQRWGQKLGTSIISVGGSLRPLSAGPSSSSSPFGSPHHAGSSSSSASSYHPPRIDLPSTLSTFGSSSTPFNLSSYLQSQYSTSSPALAVHHAAELRKRKEQTSEELRSYVTRHYPAFIESTKEILTIEGDMAQLTSMLGQFNAHLGHMASPSLAYSDERLFKRGKEREREAVQGSERQLKEALALEEWNEDLRSTIYERKFDKAVRIIEMTWKRWDKQERMAAKAAQHNSRPTAASASTSAIEAEMEDRVTQLVETLTAELRSATIKKFERRRLIGWLVRLHEAEAALQIYLSHRSSLLQSAVRSIKLTGDLPVYIHDLSSIVFGHLAVTCRDAQQLFTDERDRQSAVVVWCVQELQGYSHRMAKQIFSSHSQFPVIAAALRAAFACCQSVEAQGLSFSHQLARQLAAPLVDCVQRHYRQAAVMVAEQLQDEEWRVAELWVHAKEGRRGHGRKKPLKLTSSAKFLYDTIRGLLKDLMPLLDPVHLHPLHSTLTAPIVTGLISLFESYLLRLAGAAQQGLNSTLDDLQSLSIVANAFYLADDLLPRVGREFRLHFGRVVPELQEFGAQLGQLYEALQDGYCHKRTTYWLSSVLHWPQLAKVEYANPNPLQLSPFAPSAAVSASSLSVSAPWVALHDYFAMLRAIIGKCLSPLAIPVVLSACFEELLHSILDDTAWGQLTLGYGGLLQLTRDLSFFAAATRAFETEQLHHLMAEAISRARTDYVRLTRADEHDTRQAQDRQEGELATRMDGALQLHTLTHIEEEETEARKQESRSQAAGKQRSSGRGRRGEEEKSGGKVSKATSKGRTEKKTADADDGDDDDGKH